MPLTPGQRRLYLGHYNYMTQEWQPDGTVILTIAGGPASQTHRMHARNLWEDSEEILSEEEIPNGPPEHIRRRLDEASRPP